jgi:hypothetical protein
MKRCKPYTKLIILSTLFALSSLLPPTHALADDDREPSFLPTWKLLNKEGKQQFIAGYLKGWHAASRVNKLATEYIRKNPSTAVASLESLTSVYDVSSIPPDTLVTLVDQFYSDPANGAAGLSVAVTSARGAFGQSG